MLGTINPNHRNYFAKAPAAKKAAKKELKKAEEESPSEEAPSEAEVFDLTKGEQHMILRDFGLSNKEIKALRYEKNRVDKILELYDKLED